MVRPMSQPWCCCGRPPGYATTGPGRDFLEDPPGEPGEAGGLEAEAASRGAEADRLKSSITGASVCGICVLRSMYTPNTLCS
mmetsp:Transcript_73248/g.177091  ORF Transcript_73248/g.177091 Transcript_73248/m.177091 type:complete len:82 (-) Transcript_73248:1792-2037(-)